MRFRRELRSHLTRYRTRRSWHCYESGMDEMELDIHIDNLLDGDCTYIIFSMSLKYFASS